MGAAAPPSVVAAGSPAALLTSGLEGFGCGAVFAPSVAAPFAAPLAPAEPAGFFTSRAWSRETFRSVNRMVFPSRRPIEY